MANYPEFIGSDGVLRQNFILSTTISYRFFTGSCPADTADMQVSIRGGEYTSDPDYITFEGTSFTVPNPSAFPDGLQLFPGSNSIKVRSILSNGTTTQEAVVDGTLVLEADVDGVLTAPIGIFVERLDSTIEVTIEGLANDDTVVGYHFYSSSQPGGGSIGYFRINPQMLITGDVVEEVDNLAALEVDTEIVLDSEGNPAADPLYFRVLGTQEDRIGTVLGTSFDERLEVPETSERLRIGTTVQTLREVLQFSFEHDRQGSLGTDPPTLPHSALSTIPETDSLYYVTTAVHLIDGIEVESHFSPEVLASPLRITPGVGSFPQVSRQAIVQDMVTSIYRSNPAVRVDPGSSMRDTVIDPFTTEADRARFIVDVLHNSSSFATLLLIDDPTLSGESIAVNQSSYKVAIKQAFFLSTNTAVQSIIDNLFDKLASNYGVIRDGGKRARGEVTFYVTSKPSTGITRTIGTAVSGGSSSYRTTSTAIISPTGGGRNFNPSTGHYFARAYIQSNIAGSAANLAAGQIKVIAANTLNVRVVNESPTFGGTDRESNRDLALRSMRVLASVDSGTLQGYTNNAINTAGVSQVSVIDSGSALMQRDLNEDGRHVGGKVDIYLRGESVAQVTDTFAFQFETRKRQQFEPVGDLSSLRFRAVDPALSETNPIIEVLNLPALDLVFENISQGYDFDLTNVQIVSYNMIELDPGYNDPIAHNLVDEIRGSYRYRTSSQFVLTRQPVIEILSFEGTQTGVVDSDIYDLYRVSDPLLLGRSTEAGDYIQVTEPLEGGTTIPSSTPLDIVAESHTMLEGIEYLDNLGTNQLTVNVYNEDSTITYNGPLSSDAQRDYTFIDGDETTPLGIQLTDASRIAVGQTVLVDYSYDENYTVTYTSNAVVSVVQDNIDNDSHITADAIVKWAVEVEVDLGATIVLVSTTNLERSQAVVDSSIRTALVRLFGVFGLGSPVRQSDVIRTLDAVPGVSYVVTPLTKMVRSDDALVVREVVSTDTDSDSEYITAWSSPLVDVYLLKNALDSATENAGGERNQFRGVFQDEVQLAHNEIAPNVNGYPIGSGTGNCFIIGSNGLNIPGYSDAATIEANNVLPADDDEKAAAVLSIRQGLTSNRVLVSFVPGETPTESDYTVTYVVSGDTGVKNIEPGPIEYLVLGDLDFAYDVTT